MPTIQEFIASAFITSEVRRVDDNPNMDDGGRDTMDHWRVGRYRAGTWQTWTAYEAQQKNERARVAEIEARERTRWAKYEEREAA